MRACGLAVAAITAGFIPLAALLGRQPSTVTGVVLLSLAPVYLVAWALAGRDPWQHRLISLIAALPGVFAIFMLYMSTAYYAE